VENFQRGNPTTDNPFNPTQLLVNEYLQMGIEPVEILQADLRSKTYSPRRILVYSINNDGDNKYYAFMGGTYKAAQEVMSGEWYKIADTEDTDVVSEEPVISGPPQPPIGIGVEGKATKTQDTISKLIKENALGLTSTAITHSNAYNKVNFAVNTKGKVYNDQKLLLTYPDGSNPLVLTANGGNDLTQSGIDVDSFTPDISYPIGSVLTSLIYDFTNVITGGSTLDNLYQGITTNYIYIRPEEFLTPSTSSFSMYTRDNFGSVQPSNFVTRSSVYASFFIPDNYEVTAVDVYGSANRSFGLYESTHSSGSAVSIQTGGTMNTTMTLTTAHEIVVGKYGIIKISLGAATDKIYGARITIQEI
jgi:hypothetical protein